MNLGKAITEIEVEPTDVIAADLEDALSSFRSRTPAGGPVGDRKQEETEQAVSPA